MPGWHEATKNLQLRDEIQMLGLIQEQHPDRCALFMQWKQLDWPVMVDSFNELGVAVVPITLLIDEYGIIRDTPRRGDPAQIVGGFLAADFDPPDGIDTSIDPVGSSKPNVNALVRAATRGGSASVRARAGLALAHWGEQGQFNQAIAQLQRATQMSPDDGLMQFQLGVAYRKRFDSAERQPGDFQSASTHWSNALGIDPNQYIWRRRIQQYGPRLDKPYSFYDWVTEARQTIEQRGEQPIVLTVEPIGSEFAHRAPFSTTQDQIELPADAARITQIEPGQIDAELAVVPVRIKPSEVARVHIMFKPVAGQAHWNNEVDPLRLWVTVPEGWEVDQPSVTGENPPEVTTRETRTFELEVRAPPDANGDVELRVLALYYMCKDVDGVCLYRRHELTIPVRVHVDGP